MRITRHIQKSRQGRPKDIFTEEELTAFFNHVRELKPKLPPESEEHLIQFYIKREKFGLDKDSISMDQRQYGALIRLSYAFAKLLFKHTVDEECVKLAIDIFKQSVSSFGITLEEGGSTAEGSRFFITNKDNKDSAFKKLFARMKSEKNDVFEKELIEEMVKLKQWNTKDTAESYIKNQYDKGRVSINKTGRVVLVD